MKIIGDTLYLDFEELTRAGIKSKTIEMGVYRNSRFWKSVNDPEDRRRVLIEWDAMRQQYKDKVVAWLGCEPHTWLQRQQDKSVIHEQQLARLSLKSLVQPRSEHYELLIRSMDKDEAMKRTRALAWLVLLVSVRGKSDAQELGFDNKEAFLDAALEQLVKEQREGLVKFTQRTPITHKRTLRDWMKRYKDQGAACLKNAWEGNRNASKLEDEQIKFIMTLAADPHKPPLPMVAYLYNREAAKRGWQQVTYVTVRNWLLKPELKRIWEMGRHGEESWYQQYDLTILREAPSAPDVMWVGDGTPLDLYYKRVVKKWDEKNQRWTERTSYYNRLDVFLVIDAFSWRILGWSLVEHENALSVRQALKMAVQENLRLPRQFQHDGGSGIEAQQWLIEQLEIYNTKTRPYSPKAKVIETIIGNIQSNVLRYFDNWSGMNITAKKEDSRFNPDFLKQVKDEIPDYEGLIAQWRQVVDIWNNKATKLRKAPNAKYFSTQTAGKEVDALAFISMFWEKRRDTCLYKQDGITIQIDGQRHHFQVLDADFYKQHIRDRFEVVYDRDCLDYVYLYQDGKPVLDEQGEPVIATAAELVPMAVHDMEEGDRERLNRLLEIKDQVKKDTLEEVAELRAYAAEENIKLGARYVFKDELNTAENAFKRSRLDDVDWEKELENMYFDED